MSKRSLKTIAEIVLMGGSHAGKTLEERRHTLFLNLIQIIGMIILTLMGVASIRQGGVFRGAFDIFTGGILLVALVLLRLSKRLKLPSVLCLSAVTLLFYYLLLEGGGDKSGALWIVAYPLIAIFIVGLTPGVVFTVVMFLAICAYAFFGAPIRSLLSPVLPGLADYGSNFGLRILFAYILTTALGVFYEAVRKNTQKKFESNVLALEKTTRDLTQRRNETDSIMKNVREGIFLLDREQRITTEYSRELESILERGSLAGVRLSDIVKPGVPEKVVSVLEDYLDMLYQPHDNPDLLREINPIDKVEFNLPVAEGGFKTKHLAFSFAPLGENGARQVLGTVRDVTSETNLVKELEAQEDKTKREMQKLSQIINVAPALMNEFIEDAEEEFENVNTLLKSEEENYSLLLPLLYQSIHAVKGNALLLGLGSLGNRLHNLESELNLYLARPKVEWNDLFNFTAGLGEMQKEIEEIKAVIEKLMAFQTNMSLSGLEQKNLLLTTLRRLVEKMAAEQEKEAALVMQDFRADAISPRYRKLVKEVLIQIIRNAVTHGLETPAVRVAAGKPQRGNIVIGCEKRQSRLRVTVRDNGGGLDPNAIRERAKTLPAFANLDLDKLSEGQVMSLIFKPGFSTSAAATLDSGRGVGLSLVKRRVEEAGGLLKVRTGKGKFTEFEISLPT
ncbi:MAG: Hpt domain-containing protein [Spirochaetales bacterium]|nr:Hpt domain-containing protein [Spirochaetales bacterium]